MRLIDADEVLTHLKPYEPSDETATVTLGTALRLIHNAIDPSPTIDAVPISELLNLRDNLYETDRITMNGLKLLNQLIAKYDRSVQNNAVD